MTFIVYMGVMVNAYLCWMLAENEIKAARYHTATVCILSAIVWLMLGVGLLGK